MRELFEPAPKFSRWQEGCDDARAGRAPNPPNPGKHPRWDDENRSYGFGYDWGKKRVEEEKRLGTPR